MLAMMFETKREDIAGSSPASTRQTSTHFDPEAEATSEAPFPRGCSGSFTTPVSLVPPLISPRAPMASLPRNATAVSDLLATKQRLAPPPPPADTPQPIAAASNSSASTSATACAPSPGVAPALKPAASRRPLTSTTASTMLPGTRSLLTGRTSGAPLSQAGSARLRSGSSTLLGSARSGRASSTVSSRCHSPVSLARAKQSGVKSVADSLRQKLPSTAFSHFSFDVAKYLREVAQRAQEATVLRVLPKAQQLEQLVAQEQMMRDVLVAEEWSNRTTVQNKRADEYNKRVMSQLAARNKATQELMKKQHADEMTAQKTLVAESQKTTDNEIRDKLQLVNQLQPRNTVVAAALADLKKEGGDLAVIGELLEEEKRLRKALKADVRFQSSASAGEGGAFTFWLKQCIASSFNAAAILSASPLRAAVADVVGFPSKLAQEKRVLTVRRVEDDKHVLLWAQARCLVGEPAETAAAASNLIEKASAVFSEAISMVLWSKEDYAELSKLAKQSEEVAAVNPKSNSVLRVEGVASVPLSNKEVQALAETAATL